MQRGRRCQPQQLASLPMHEVSRCGEAWATATWPAPALLLVRQRHTVIAARGRGHPWPRPPALLALHTQSQVSDCSNRVHGLLASLPQPKHCHVAAPDTTHVLSAHHCP